MLPTNSFVMSGKGALGGSCLPSFGRDRSRDCDFGCLFSSSSGEGQSLQIDASKGVTLC